MLHSDFELIHCGVIGCQWRVHAGNSINMLMPFHTYDEKFTRRMQAIALFRDQHGTRLSPESKARLEAKIDCEEGRKTGDLRRILRSRVSTVEKLRALSVSNRPLYAVRRKLYGLLSGW